MTKSIVSDYSIAMMRAHSAEQRGDVAEASNQRAIMERIDAMRLSDGRSALNVATMASMLNTPVTEEN